MTAMIILIQPRTKIEAQTVCKNICIIDMDVLYTKIWKIKNVLGNLPDSANLWQAGT